MVRVPRARNGDAMTDLTPTWIPARIGPPRIAWPNIFQYRTRDGKLHDLPVGKEIPYETEVHDEAAYRALGDSGQLRDPLHTGQPRWGVPINNSRTA